VRAALANAPRMLRTLVCESARRVLVSNAARTRGWMQAGDPAMAAVTADELRFVGQRLVDAIA